MLKVSASILEKVKVELDKLNVKFEPKIDGLKTSDSNANQEICNTKTIIDELKSKNLVSDVKIDDFNKKADALTVRGSTLNDKEK